jgi:hypothetical protein
MREIVMICGMMVLGCFVFGLIAGSGNSLIKTSGDVFRKYTEKQEKAGSIITESGVSGIRSGCGTAFDACKEGSAAS